MSTQSAYSSTHPDVLAAMDAADADQLAFHNTLMELRAEFGDVAVYYSDSPGWRSFSGFIPAPTVEGVAWRQKRSGSFWPKQTTKAGKELHQRLSALRFRLRGMPGMPGSVHYAATSYEHGLARYGGEVWATWSCSHDVAEGGDGRVDLAMWQRRRLSEYFAAKEAADAPQPAKAAS